jgi:Transposase DDE domain
MEYQIWKEVVALIDSLKQPRTPVRFDFSDADIVKVFYWAVICDRPTGWSCRTENWPSFLRRRQLPSDSTMSRRLRSVRVRSLLNNLEHRVIAPKEPGLFWLIDGKSLPIGGCSKDRQAGYGRAAGCKAKGYKLHAIIGDRDDSVAVWRVAPMNKDERVMAERMLKQVPPQVLGYAIADGNYDSNKLHQICDQHGNLQWVSPRRYGPGKGTGHRKQTAGRIRSMELIENPFPKFAKQLLKDRGAIERCFGNLTNFGGGLTCLPSWVRTHRRVHRWVQAKLILKRIRHDLKLTTCAA